MSYFINPYFLIVAKKSDTEGVNTHLRATIFDSQSSCYVYHTIPFFIMAKSTRSERKRRVERWKLGRLGKIAEDKIETVLYYTLHNRQAWQGQSSCLHSLHIQIKAKYPDRFSGEQGLGGIE